MNSIDVGMIGLHSQSISVFPIKTFWPIVSKATRGQQFLFIENSSYYIWLSRCRVTSNGWLMLMLMSVAVVSFSYQVSDIDLTYYRTHTFPRICLHQYSAMILLSIRQYQFKCSIQLWELVTMNKVVVVVGLYNWKNQQFRLFAQFSPKKCFWIRKQ